MRRTKQEKAIEKPIRREHIARHASEITWEKYADTLVNIL